MESFAARRANIALDRIGAAATPAASKETVLVVTDDGELRAVLTRVLGRQGYRVVAAAHSGHALLACLGNGRIDILLTELSMAETSGPVLTDQLRRHHPALRVVYFGNPGTPECDDVLVRPFTRDDLLTKLEAVGATAQAF